MGQDANPAPSQSPRRRAETSTGPLRWIALASASLLIAGTAVVAAPATAAPAAARNNTREISDTFKRTVKSGLGVTSSGSRYVTKASKKTELSVRGHRGVARMTSGAAAFQAAVPSVKLHDASVRSTFGLASIPRSGGVYFGVEARKSHRGYYRAAAKVGAGRKITLNITRYDGRGHARLTRTIALPWRYTPHGKINLELNVTGGKNVLLQARAWPAGTSAPTWQLTASDSSARRLSSRGAPGFSAYLSGKSRSATVQFDDFSAVPSRPVATAAERTAPRSEPKPAPERPSTTTPEPTPTWPQTPPPTSTPPPAVGTTGVPEGTRLTVHDGDLTVTQAGTVVDSLDIRGYLRIKAANVTVKNSIVRGRAGLGNTSMALIQNSSPGVVIEDSELVAQYPTYYIDGFVGSNTTFSRVNIHGVVDSVKIIGDNVVVKDSWLHDNLYYAQVPSGGDTHNDNIQIGVGKDITIHNNVMTGTRNAVLMITQDRGPVGNVTFSNNRVDNGACSINLAEKTYGPLQGLSFIDNVFGTAQLHSRCAIIAPSSTTRLLTLTNNLFLDGQPVPVSRG